MIVKGIFEAEQGFKGVEADLALNDNDEDLLRHREMLRRRREEDTASRQREKEAAREMRRREDEARRKRQEEELEREEAEESRAREAKQATETLCRRQLQAAARIQAHLRGRRSRKGKHITSPMVVAKLHVEPWEPLTKK
jgi:hypothetical protein